MQAIPAWSTAAPAVSTIMDKNGRPSSTPLSRLTGDALACFGASGGLAIAIADDLLARGGWTVDLVSREGCSSVVVERFYESMEEGTTRLITVGHSYDEFKADRPYKVYLFTQALFEPRPLVETADGRVEEELKIGLNDPISSRARSFAIIPLPEKSGGILPSSDPLPHTLASETLRSTVRSSTDSSGSFAP